MASFSSYEQLLLELVNRARLDPNGEAQTYGIALNAGLPAGTLSGVAKQVLAPQSLLNNSARGHSQWMINTDIFSHTGSSGSDPGQRMTSAGYQFGGDFWTWGENIAWTGTTGTPNVGQSTAEIHGNLFKSAGHRLNILNGDFRELGAGVLTGAFTSQGSAYNSVMATENFATSGSKAYITGVAIRDADFDNFYDIGEGRAGLSVVFKAGTAIVGSTATQAAGGYAFAADNTNLSVTFSGGGLAASVTATIAGGAQNAKVDLSGDNKILSSASTTLEAGAVSLKLLGVAHLNGFGNSANNSLEGNKGNNYLNGNAGNDTLSGSLGNDTLIGGAGKDVMYGGAGVDRFDFNAVSESSASAALRDQIRDWDAGGNADIIDLATIDAKAAAATANDTFVFLATKGAAFSGQGQVRWYWEDLAGTASDKTIIAINTDANKLTAEFHIEIAGLKAITAGDFTL